MLSLSVRQVARMCLSTALVLCAVMTLTGCDARLMAAGHAVSLCASFGMVWAVINMDKFKS